MSGAAVPVMVTKQHPTLFPEGKFLQFIQKDQCPMKIFFLTTTVLMIGKYTRFVYLLLLIIITPVSP